MSHLPPSPAVAILPIPAVRAMLQLARTLRGLALNHPHPLPDTPSTAHFDPGHEAVMMGYDFHLTPHGPRLIEVNTNAGGLLMAHVAQHPGFPSGPEFPFPLLDPNNRRQQRLINSFTEEMRLFAHQPIQRMVILDEKPEEQFLYPEMVACAKLMSEAGIACRIVDPNELDMDETGVFLQGERVDLIYNRHCDFYLQTPPLAGLRAAWLNRRVCLSPNPRAYGLLADKRHLVNWSDATHLRTLGCDAPTIARLTTLIPETRLLATLEPETVWKERARWVFKPGTGGFGGRGVLLGEKISRTRFNTLDPTHTLVQRHIPPALVTTPQGAPFKTDIRLFMYRDRLLGIGVRAYRGQVTNFREPGNGFLPVRLIQASDGVYPLEQSR
ncbi:MAG: hypothetical protein H7834_14575 [Magnetococcus sp. YQC-9]